MNHRIMKSYTCVLNHYLISDFIFISCISYNKLFIYYIDSIIQSESLISSSFEGNTTKNKKIRLLNYFVMLREYDLIDDYHLKNGSSDN